jgi:hypothetical protein
MRSLRKNRGVQPGAALFYQVGRAEQYFNEGFITREERRAMIEKATANYRRAVEGVEQGT